MDTVDENKEEDITLIDDITFPIFDDIINPIISLDEAVLNQ